MKTKDKIKVPVQQRTSSFADPLKYKIVSDEQFNLTVEKAFAFLELKTFSGERPVREKHVQFLYDEWFSGRFLWQNIILASARLNQDEFRINGQHTCWMRVNIPGDVKAPIRHMIYQVSDQEQLRGLYSAFDRGAPRTYGHVAKVLLLDTEAGNEIPGSYISNLVAGFKIYFSPNWKSKMSATELTSLINKNYAQHFNIVGRFMTIHYSDDIIVRRAPVVAAMFSTFEKNVQKSDEFWAPIFNGIGLDKKSDPRWLLRRYLQQNSLGNANGKHIEQEDMFNVCINAWNHWRDGKELSVLKSVEKRSKARA